MVRNARELLLDRLQKRPAVVARAKAALSRRPLPPGELDPPLDLIEKGYKKGKAERKIS